MSVTLAEMSLIAKANALAASLATWVKFLESPLIAADSARVAYGEERIEQCRAKLAEVHGQIDAMRGVRA